MTDRRGLYEKFIVARTDQTDRPGAKHEGCEYFVLDLTHDKHARAALLAYAKDCEEERPQLAVDLRARVAPEQHEKCRRCGGTGEVSCDNVFGCEDPDDGEVTCPHCSGTGRDGEGCRCGTDGDVGACPAGPAGAKP